MRGQRGEAEFEAGRLRSGFSKTETCGINSNAECLIISIMKKKRIIGIMGLLYESLRNLYIFSTPQNA